MPGNVYEYDTKEIIAPEMRPKSFGSFEKRAPGARFSKLPKLSRSISGAIISYVSQKLRSFQEWNFPTRLPFRILKS